MTQFMDGGVTPPYGATLAVWRDPSPVSMAGRLAPRYPRYYRTGLVSAGAHSSQNRTILGRHSSENRAMWAGQTAPLSHRHISGG